MWNTSWPSVDQINLDRNLDSLAALVQEQDPSEPVSAELSRFLVVRTCGYIEQSVERSCIAYLTSKSAPRCLRFGESWLGYGANPKPEALKKLVNRFDKEWANELEAFFKENDDLLSRELSFLVDARNSISHGRNQGITQRKALNLVPYAHTTTQWFITKFDPR